MNAGIKGLDTFLGGPFRLVGNCASVPLEEVDPSRTLVLGETVEAGLVG